MQQDTALPVGGDRHRQVQHVACEMVRNAEGHKAENADRVRAWGGRGQGRLPEKMTVLVRISAGSSCHGKWLVGEE